MKNVKIKWSNDLKNLLSRLQFWCRKRVIKDP